MRTSFSLFVLALMALFQLSLAGNCASTSAKKEYSKDKTQKEIKAYNARIKKISDEEAKEKNARLKKQHLQEIEDHEVSDWRFLVKRRVNDIDSYFGTMEWKLQQNLLPNPEKILDQSETYFKKLMKEAQEIRALAKEVQPELKEFEAHCNKEPNSNERKDYKIKMEHYADLYNGLINAVLTFKKNCEKYRDTLKELESKEGFLGQFLKNYVVHFIDDLTKNKNEEFSSFVKHRIDYVMRDEYIANAEYQPK